MSSDDPRPLAISDQFGQQASWSSTNRQDNTLSKPSASLAFFKLNTADMSAALSFYQNVFGFSVTTSFDEPDFIEHIMALPGQERGPSLLLVAYKDGRDVSVGKGHGPVGIVTDDIQGLFAKAVEAGASPAVPIFDLGGTRVAIVLDPEGHEIELLQFGNS